MNKYIACEFRIRNLISKFGKIPISRFMEEVISSKYGYYNNNLINNDFITAPEISQLFGEMIGIYCWQKWKDLGSPNNIAIIELGPGNGTLIYDILKTIKNINDFYESIEVHLVEMSDLLSITQKSKLEEFDINKFWYKSIDDIELDIPVIFIANEFFDSLPINQYIKSKNNWFEIFVVINQLTNNLEFSKLPIETISKEALDFYINIEDDSIVEISDQSIYIAKKIAELINKNSGNGIIIDYGYNISYETRKITNSTLQSVKNHKFHPVLLDAGSADITSHVDFYSLYKAIESRNIQSKIITQREFLLAIGIEIRAENLAKQKSIKEKYDIYNSLNRLISINYMGELFKVMIL